MVSPWVSPLVSLWCLIVCPFGVPLVSHCVSLWVSLWISFWVSHCVSLWVSHWVSLWCPIVCTFGCPFGYPFGCPFGCPFSVPLVSLWISFWVSHCVSLWVSHWVSHCVSLWVSFLCPFGCPFGVPLGVPLSVPLDVPLVSLWVSFRMPLWCSFGCPLGCPRWGFPGSGSEEAVRSSAQRSAGSSGGGGGSPSSATPRGLLRAVCSTAWPLRSSAELFAGCGRALCTQQQDAAPLTPLLSPPRLLVAGELRGALSARLPRGLDAVPHQTPRGLEGRRARSAPGLLQTPNPSAQHRRGVPFEVPHLEALPFAELDQRMPVGSLHPSLSCGRRVPMSPSGGTGMQCGSRRGSIRALLLESKTEIKAVNQKSSACRPRSQTSPVISSLIRLFIPRVGFSPCRLPSLISCPHGAELGANPAWERGLTEAPGSTPGTGWRAQPCSHCCISPQTHPKCIDPAVRAAFTSQPKGSDGAGTFPAAGRGCLPSGAESRAASHAALQGGMHGAHCIPCSTAGRDARCSLHPVQCCREGSMVLIASHAALQGGMHAAHAAVQGGMHGAHCSTTAVTVVVGGRENAMGNGRHPSGPSWKWKWGGNTVGLGWVQGGVGGALRGAAP